MESIPASPITLGRRYTIERELGRGATSTVYLAHDAADGRAVAVKVLRQELAESIAASRFLREIKVNEGLNHPQIAAVLDSGAEGGKLFFVLPYMEGGSLRQRLEREGQLPVGEVLAIARPIADALEYAHGKGLIHRDVKPENILFSSGQACLADFGIARAIERAAGESTTETGVARGTPTYMSPEQGAAERTIDGRSDIYSLGCVVYEMLAGEPPFTGPTTHAIVARHMHEKPRDLRIVRPNIPDAVQEVLDKALAKSPADRYQTARAFIDALVIAASRPVAARRLPIRRRPLAIAAIAGTLLIVALTAMRLASVFRVPAATVSLDPRRIAVLDFEDQSPGHGEAHVASGLTVALIHELSGTPAIRVLSRNAVKTFREQGLPLDSMIAAMHIGSLVEGTLQRSNDRLRVTVQLVDGATKTEIESATIDRPLGELLALEDALAHQVALLLRHRIGVEVRVRQAAAGTKNQRARELAFVADKLRDDAASLMASGEATNVENGLTMLRQADSVLALAERADGAWIAPIIAEGWVALTLARNQADPKRAQAFSRAVGHANRALARQPENAAALELRGAARYWQAARLDLDDAQLNRNLEGAEFDLRRSLSIDTSLATARGTLSLVHVARGDVAEAERDASAALAMDTYLMDAPAILLALYGATLMNGSLPESWRWCDRGSEDYPRNPRFIECRLTLMAEDQSRPPDPKLAWTLVAKATAIDPPAHAAASGLDYQPLYREMMAAIISARAGESDSARAVARRARAAVQNRPGLRTDLEYEDAYLHLILGERSETIRLLSDYLAARPSLRGLVARHPRWRPLQSDSAFKRLVERRER